MMSITVNNIVSFQIEKGEWRVSAIILFDGVCNLCNHSVQFILKRDKDQHFKFASLQSETGKQLIEKYQIEPNMKSLVLIEENQYFLKSTAALRICRNLNGLWSILIILLIIPRPLRDALYTIIANNRYKWFGKSESCMLPTTELKERFLP